MKLDQLIVTQDSLRNPEQLGAMAQAVRCGMFFDQTTLTAHDPKHDRLIEIAKIGNDYFVHNGHHRCVAIAFGKRDYLREDEYYVKEWKSKDYDVVNFDVGYVTPFNIYMEVRLADFAAYKQFAVSLPKLLGGTHFDTKNIIYNMKWAYAQPRERDFLEEHVYYLASKYGKVEAVPMFEFTQGGRIQWHAWELFDEYKLAEASTR